MSTIRPDYVMKKIRLNKKNIDFFKVDEKQRRMIRASKVKGIAKAMKDGKHFGAPFVCNYTDDDANKLVDGNHRYEAFLEVLDTNPAFEIDVWYARYDYLTETEEREVYKTWNIGTKQSADDFLKIYWKTIPFGKEMEKQLNASIYASKTKIKIKTLVGNHIEAKKQGKFRGGYSGSAETAVSDFCKINGEDIITMKAYMKDAEAIFGAFSPDDVYWKGTAQSVFYRLWFDNRTTVSRNVFIRKISKLFNGPNKRLKWEMTCRGGGREASKILFSQVMPFLEGFSFASI